ncbi:proline racemase family protein [Melioribacteraceae bacterium 4301-Me]|uniref:proline racemase family protein n=1 Tax=Pyranulibacter aquaticus TaxID=3163344 RepID=UPI003594C8A9
MSTTFRIRKIAEWMHPEDWTEIETIDVHTAGEPLRIILSGLPEIKGYTILEKRQYMKENLDDFRKALMWEPRGHADMYGCVITPPERKDSNFGALFLHNEGYSTMCGHGIIGLTKVVLETGMMEKNSPVTTIKIDTPAGQIISYAKIENDEISSIYFHNVPSFVLMKDELINVPEIGKVKFDVAFGGAFYVFVKAEEIGLKLVQENVDELIHKGMLIKKTVMNNFKIEHPFDNELSFLYGTIFYGKSYSNEADSRNVCIFADGEVDRSPTGTGVSARMALHYFDNEIKLNQPMIIESIIGTKFIGKAVAETKFGPYRAVIPEIEGNAFITGKSVFYIDPKDPLKHGFLVR